MRDTVFCIVDDCDRVSVEQSIHDKVNAVQEYVPGYRLKQDVQFRRMDDRSLESELAPGNAGWLVSTFLEVEGAGHYLPPYAGNLDIMTSAARRVGEQLASELSAA
jgi:acetaldehyde dehydrogenase